MLNGDLFVKYKSVVYIEVLPSCLISTSGGLSVDGGSRCIEMGLSGLKVLYMSFCFRSNTQIHTVIKICMEIQCLFCTLCLAC